jgi:hypothetical protein
MMKGDVPQADASVKPPVNLIFDDGLPAVPGDAAFSTDAVKAHVASLGAAVDGYNYVGVSQPPAGQE